MATLLSMGFNNKVYALKQGEYGTPVEAQYVAKIFRDWQYPEWEHQALIQAAKVNNLMVKVWSLIPHPKKEVNLLIMERLIPVQPRALDKETRLQHLQKFLKELRELHANDMAHCDIKRPSHCTKNTGDEWDNVVPTLEGIRLIDAGSMTESEDPCFEREVSKDLADFCEFAKWFMQDVIPDKDMIPILREWLNI